LRNNQFTVHYLDGSTQRRILATGAELRVVLEDDFHLNLGAIDNLDYTLQNVVEQFIANDNP
jgi:N-hydroxyarylamine O-acetyltransferase